MALLVKFVIPMHPDLLSDACRLYATTPDQLSPLSGGNSTAVYQFPLSYASGHAVLRIGVEDCPAAHTLGMLDWVSYLKMHGAPVTAPIPSICGNLMESLQYDGTRYTLTVFEKADGTLAEDLHPADWTDTLFQSIGRAAGRLHRISKGYVPSTSSLTRPHWFDSYEIRMALQLLANSRDPARDFLTSLMDELRQLPDRPDEYGMIHDDLHFANFLITSGQQVIIIDYDDCGYGWFAMDVAMALFDVLVLYNPADDITGQVFARRFMLNYLEGYRSENAISLFWQCQIPHFLKLKELCIYPTLIGHPEITQPDTWVGRFMRDRPCRIAANLPYVDLDFSNL